MAMLHPFASFPSSVRAGVYDGDVLTELPFPAQLLKQVHGTEIVEVTSIGAEMEGDALLTSTPGVCLMIKSADCIPLVFADLKAGWIGAVHAGWRGLVAGIVPKTLARMVEKGVQVGHLQIGIGPSLGVECAEFSDPFSEIPEAYHWAIQGDSVGKTGAGHVDLWAILEKQLAEAGVKMSQVEWMRVCTACDPTWFSWRRDQTKGRLGSFIELLG